MFYISCEYLLLQISVYLNMLNAPPWYEHLLTIQGQLPQYKYDILIQMFADLAIVGLNPVYFPQRLVLFLPTV